ncbi:hypothetical protein Taro_003972 [Colocasia esculenta]|uniref:Uncharacterized protein n=1 Tax=Colocasia esculenta TaxID=4460 RepID=A0A843TQB4_COLES|nr:hypothetical protein [Colocasia esculenta]
MDFPRVLDPLHSPFFEARTVFLHRPELDGKIPRRQDLPLMANDIAVYFVGRPDYAPWLPVDDVEVCQLTTTSKGVRSG